LPAVLVDQVFQHHGQRHAVQRVVGLRMVHTVIVRVENRWTLGGVAGATTRALAPRDNPSP
jgi:hypothetical protein